MSQVVLTNHRSPRIIVVGQGEAWIGRRGSPRSVELPIRITHIDNAEEADAGGNTRAA